MRFLSLLKKLVGSIFLLIFLALLNNCIDFFFRVKLKWFGDSQLYLIHLLKLREKVVSEENLFKTYYDIRDIKKYLHSQNKFEFPKEFPTTDKTLYKSPEQKVKHFTLNT